MSTKKQFNLHLKPNQYINIATWTDVISHESAKQGEYSDTGVNWINSYCDNLYDAAIELALFLSNNYTDSYTDITEVIYGVDVEEDLSNGDTYYKRCSIITDGENLDDAQKKALNKLVSKLLNK